MSTQDDPKLSMEERGRYSWQLSVPEYGEEGQRRLKAASVFVSRIGGVGGTVAMQLAAAGVGRLVLAHKGNVRIDDLNRQMLMTTDWIGKPRIESAVRRLAELNPHVTVETYPENLSEENANAMTRGCDVLVGAAPLFQERLALNAVAVKHRQPLVDCAMYDLEARVTSIRAGETPCLSCLCPEPPPQWKRQFPVFSAVSSAVGCLAAMEVIKLIAGFGEPLLGRLLVCDLRDMRFHVVPIARAPDCVVCGAK